MKLLLSFLGGLLFLSAGFAKGPFGDVTKNTFSYGSDQSKCTAEKILRTAVADTGIDLVDGESGFVWQCKKGQGPETAEERRCPYDQYMDEKSYTCYASNGKGYPYVCVAGGKSVDVEEKYADAKNIQKIPRVRFSQMFVFNSNGNSKEYTMDSKGCEATDYSTYDNTGYFNNGSAGSSKEKCVKLLKDAVGGGYMYPPRFEHNIKGMKFCNPEQGKDSEYVDAYLTKTKELYHCYEAYPNLPELYKKAGTGGSNKNSQEQKAQN